MPYTIWKCQASAVNNQPGPLQFILAKSPAGHLDVSAGTSVAMHAGDSGLFNADQNEVEVAADTLNGSINSSTTTVALTSGAHVPNGATILVDGEQMTVSSGGLTASLTVVRGANGTVAASHTSGATVFAVCTFTYTDTTHGTIGTSLSGTLSNVAWQTSQTAAAAAAAYCKSLVGAGAYMLSQVATLTNPPFPSTFVNYDFSSGPSTIYLFVVSVNTSVTPNQPTQLVATSNDQSSPAASAFSYAQQQALANVANSTSIADCVDYRQYGVPFLLKAN